MAAPSRIQGHWDDTLDEGPLREPSAVIGGHKVYRKESCTLDHKVRRPDGSIAHSVPSRRYFGLWQCGCCDGLIVPRLRYARTITLAKYKGDGHTNGNGNGHRKEAA